MAIALKRVYDKPSTRDGFRVLVDRLWPRGVSKEGARVDLWLKEIAPSNELRKWYHARPTQWPAFRERYLQELSEDEAANRALEELHALAVKRKALTLLFGSKELEKNNATVLKELLEGTRKPPRSTGGAAAAARIVQRASSK